MSHSVPSDSSPAHGPLADGALLVGADLVSFDRPELPIYAAPQSLWADAGRDMPLFGASVDRLFGEAGETFVASLPLPAEVPEIATSGDDPLVVMPALGDGLALPVCDHAAGIDLPLHAAHAPDLATVYNFSSDSHFLLPVHGCSWDFAKPEWFYDHHV